VELGINHFGASCRRAFQCLLPCSFRIAQPPVTTMTYRLAPHLPWVRRAFGPRGARLADLRAACVRIVVEARDLPSGRASSYSVANYVRAVLKLRALRREVAHTLLEIERCKKALETRLQPGILLAEADTLLRELNGEADIQ
jgi:hypothetical protein